MPPRKGVKADDAAAAAEAKDYASLTVVQLKAELKTRGLPQAGKKAELVSRLEENDAAEPEVENGGADEEQEKDDVIEETGEVAEPDATEHAQDEVVQPAQTDTVPKNGETTAQDEASMVEPAIVEAPEQEAAITEEPVAGGIAETEVTASKNGPTTTDDIVAPGPEPTEVESVSTQQIPIEVETANGNLDEQDTEANVVAQSQAPTATTADSSMAIDSEESRKRKRRSKSPVPSAEETNKKFKAIDGTPSHITSSTGNDVVRAALPDSQKITAFDAMELNYDDKPPPSASLKRQETADRQFRGLFNGLTSTLTQLKGEEEERPEDEETGPVAPSVHQPTRALYIRNLQRPLQQAALEARLYAIAQSPDEEQKDKRDVVESMFLDSIKTHCFVVFTSPEYATRARNRLHDRIWPDERERKVLWVDFVPAEKVPGWIAEEEDTGPRFGGRGRGGSGIKRWEVRYDKADDGTVQASLQEEGTEVIAATALDRNLVLNAHEAPVATLPRPTSPIPIVKTTPGQGFAALDDLFDSTTAKPKIYFKKVAPEVIEKRLDVLRSSTKDGSSTGEKKRFSFELSEFTDGDVSQVKVVDRGPEFGRRKVGAGRGRGAPRGGSTWRARDPPRERYRDLDRY